MKFLIDAQLPRRAIQWFRAAGFDAIHTLDLPDQNRTTDSQVIDAADLEQRVVVTKCGLRRFPHATRTAVKVVTRIDGEYE